MDDTLRDRLAAVLGSRVVRAAAVAGGSINRAFRVELADRTTAFVKAHPAGLPQLFQREAEGLRWLRAASELRVPEVLAWHDPAPAAPQGPGFLALEWIEPGRPARDFEQQLGRGLATLHRRGAPHFGLSEDNYIAALPQPNRSLADWPSFYAQRRLLPQLELASRHGRLPPDVRRALERVVTRATELCGPEEPPSHLHGDLWQGNVICDAAGSPVLVDPAVYGGHREIDIAMMKLFGGFGRTCFEAYDETYPRSPGHAQRTALYQLYPLLVHLNLFGETYVASLERALNEIW